MSRYNTGVEMILTEIVVVKEGWYDGGAWGNEK
jgi:hypothetical protein